MTTPSIPSLLQGIPRSLGSYEPVLAQIKHALRTPQCDLGTVAEAIEKDPDLTARLLRLGNSSFYGFSTRLATVSEAIGLIGIQQVQDLIVASSIVERFAGVPPDFVNMESFWRHSLACGIGARTLAVERRLPKADKCFVAGLLHDVGRLVLFLQAPRVSEQVFELSRRENLMLREAERRVLGYDHPAVSEALLRYWEYPTSLVEAVAYHHNPLASPLAPDEAAVVHVSDHLVNAMRLGSSGEPSAPPLQPGVWEHLTLPVTFLTAVVRSIDEQIETVEEAFLTASRPARRP